MEHPCIQCGAEVEDGRPFCPSCHAPQIKVPVKPPTAPVTEPLEPGTPENVQPPATPMIEPVPHRAQPQPWEIPQKNKLMMRPMFSAVLAAGFAATVALLAGAYAGSPALMMLGMFAAGGLAVTLYRRRSRYHAVTMWMGARLGAVTGAWGIGLIMVVNLFALIGSGPMDSKLKAAREQMQQAMAASPDPVALEQVKAYIATDDGLIAFLVVAMLLFVAMVVAFSALGGMLGAALFGRDSGRKEP